MPFKFAEVPPELNEDQLQEQLQAYEQDGIFDIVDEYEAQPATKTYVLSSDDDDAAVHAKVQSYKPVAGPSNEMNGSYGSSSRAAAYGNAGRPSVYATSSANHGSKRQAAALAGLDDPDFLGFGQASASRNTVASSSNTASDTERRLRAEIASIDEQIEALKASRVAVKAELDDVLARAQNRRSQAGPSIPAPAIETAPKKARINYEDSAQFSWSGQLRQRLKTVFGIDQLRLCQEGVLNAVLDGRDVICIMPTGGGKSVCFQAPAVLSRGTTLVISPLISLMSDQVMHLREKGIEAVMITAATEKSEMKDITDRLLMPEGNGNRKGIKLCYVTPEKIVKSKTFSSLLAKMDQAGLLTRIAIDESHCCSQMGHDFRPDYKKLSQLRSFFPDVPIVALTATCGKEVLTDVVRILGLKGCTPGASAEPNRTVFFSAPLYRANLHYSVVKKPSSAAAVITMMVEEILTKHADDTGIVYCLSKADTEAVAKGLREASEGKVKTGTYHAGMEDWEKQRIHKDWRRGKIKVVCATIAFGMGIDAPDVRFVFHHSVSKSMEGYYQETGRAGRDGKDSDCVLYFRPADYSRLSSMAAEDQGGHKKLATMVNFALDLTTCRKLLFDQYFGDPAQVVAAYAPSTAPSACGHCDNCLRLAAATRADISSDDEAASEKAKPPLSSKELLVHKDVTVEAWKICKILEATDRRDGKLTLSGAADLARGLQKGSFTRDKRLPNGKTERVKDALDLEQVCGGKVALNNDTTEMIILRLLMKGILSEAYVPSGYTTNTYVTTERAPAGMRYTRIKTLSELEKLIEEGGVPKLEIDVLEKPVKAKKATRAKRAAGGGAKKGKGKVKAGEESDEGEASEDEAPKKKRAKSAKTPKTSTSTKKGKKAASAAPDGNGAEDMEEADEDMDGFEDPASEDIDIDLPQALPSSERDMQGAGDDDNAFDRPIWERREQERQQRRDSQNESASRSTSTSTTRAGPKARKVSAAKSQVIDLDSD